MTCEISVSCAVRLFTKIFFHIFDHGADFFDRCFQLFGSYPKFRAPVIYFMRLSHIDSRIIWLTCLCCIIWHETYLLLLSPRVKQYSNIYLKYLQQHEISVMAMQLSQPKNTCYFLTMIS